MQTIVEELSTDFNRLSISKLLNSTAQQTNKQIKMMSKVVIVALFAFVSAVNCGVVPAAYITPYASTYNAHTINHAVASPFAAAPAKIIASPYVASPYVSSPYVASPYAYSPYSAPYAYSPYSYPSNYFL